MIVAKIAGKCRYWEICRYYMESLDVCTKCNDEERERLCPTFSELIETKKLRPEIEKLLK